MNTHGKTATTRLAAKPAVAIIGTLKGINAETKRLALVGATYQTEMHVLACSVLAFVSKHRNMNVLTQFLDTVPDMVRKNSLQTWFETFCDVSYNAAQDDLPKGWRFDADKKPRLGDAMVKPFWKFKALEGAPYQPLDTDKLIQSMIKKLETDVEYGKKSGLDTAKSAALLMALKTHTPATKAN